jgi:hypothetical protein
VFQNPDFARALTAQHRRDLERPAAHSRQRREARHAGVATHRGATSGPGYPPRAVIRLIQRRVTTA